MSLAVLEQIYQSSGPTQVERLNQGVPASVFEKLAESLGISIQALADTLGVSARTIRVRKAAGEAAGRLRTTDRKDGAGRVGSVGGVLRTVQSGDPSEIIALGNVVRENVQAALLSGNETEQVFRVFRVFRYAEEVLGSKDAARAWMQTGQRALGNRTPLSMLVRDVGAADVINILGAIEDGGYL